MSALSQNLYITFSNQKARDLIKTVGVFDKVITLDALILELFEKENFAFIVDDTIASSIIYKIIKEQQISYFDYLQSDAQSLNTIYNFIIKCYRNELLFSQFLQGEKLQALLQIDEHYQSSMVQLNWH